MGDYLLAIRQGEELSQINFAKRLGISKQNLCDVEHSRRFISPKLAAEFANKLGYSSRHFVCLCLQDILDRDGLSLTVETSKRCMNLMECCEAWHYRRTKELIWSSSFSVRKGSVLTIAF